MKQGPGSINLGYVVRAVRRRLPMLLLCVIVVPAIAVGVSLLQKKQYTAQASILFRDPQFDQKLFGTSFVQNQPDPTRVAATNLDLVALPQVAALTARHLHGITADQVSSAVTASSIGESDLVSIQATARTPVFAAKLANAYARQYIAFRRDADRGTINSAEVPLRHQISKLPKHNQFGSLGQALQQRLAQLHVLASLQTGGAELVQPAQVPSAPSSPKPVLNAALGLLLGILIGIALTVLAEALDRRLRDPAEVEQMFERPLLAALPESNAIGGADPALLSVPPAEREAFRMLWVNLRYFSMSRDIRSVLVTSADREDGKSVVAWGLAVAAASAGTRTLLIEADLRKPVFSNRFDLPSKDGLTSVLAGDVPSAEAILRLPLPVSEDGPTQGRSMDVLPAGPRPPDPADLLQSQRMTDFLTRVEESYDLVVIDTPPVAAVSDAIPLTTLVSGVIVVARLGNTIRDHLRRVSQQFRHLSAPILGVVVNAIGDLEPYEYGMDYEERSNSRPRRDHGARPLSEHEPGGDSEAIPVPAGAASPTRGFSNGTSPDHGRGGPEAPSGRSEEAPERESDSGTRGRE